MRLSQDGKSKNMKYKKSYEEKCRSMIILEIFQYSWFLDRINQDNDLFRS